MSELSQRCLAVAVAIAAVSFVHAVLPDGVAKPISALIAALAAGWVPTTKKENP